jgi:poly(rC)-binding protein 2/3/4
LFFFSILSSYIFLNSVELQKANLAQEQTTGAVGATSNGTTATTGTNIVTPTTPTPVATPNNNNVSVTDAAQNAAALASAIPLAQLLSKPGALNALTSLTALGGLTDLLGGLSNLGPPVQTTGVHRAKQFTSRQRPTSNNPNINSNDVNKLKSERSKFNPY